MRKLLLYIATSIDGYIAAPGDNLDFLSSVQVPGEDYGYAEFIKTVDTVIVGRRTYDWVRTHAPDFGHAGKERYIITRTPRPAEDGTHFYSGDLGELVKRLKEADGKHIFCDGGAQVITELLRMDLVDECTLSIVPVLLGEGIRLFADGRPQQNWKLFSAKSFPSGLVQLHYARGR